MSKLRQSIRKLLQSSIQGNIIPIIELLENSSMLTQEDEVFRKELLHRLKDKVFPPHDMDDESIQQLMHIYYDYWWTLGTQLREIDEANVKLLAELREFISSNFQNTGEFQNNDFENIESQLQQNLLETGYYSLFGRTPPFRECLIWKKEQTVNYSIELHDDSSEVLVTFLSEFISRGWLSFLTYDTASTGGWVESKRVVSTNDPPERKSDGSYDENFEITILQHEGRHFSDYNKFPNLEAPELEYRAKLTELSAADKTLYQRLERFIRGANAISRTVPHSYAEYFIILNLSRQLFKTEFEDDIEKWKEHTVAEINIIATSILDENSNYLRKLPSDHDMRFLL